MGHFSLTCAASGLPISGGDSVYAFLVYTDPYQGDNGLCRQSWHVRSWPIRARYDDYGGLNDPTGGTDAERAADAAIRKTWADAFNKDLIEAGADKHGNKAIRRGVDADALINAIQRSTVKIGPSDEFDADMLAYRCRKRGASEEEVAKRRADYVATGGETREPPVWLPTVKSVSDLLDALPPPGGLAANIARPLRTWSVADEMGGCMVRAGLNSAYQGEIADAAMQAARDALIAAGYACMITAPTAPDRYITSQIIVMPAPGADGRMDRRRGVVRTECRRVLARDPSRECEIGIAMIRADVWDRIVAAEWEKWYAPSEPKTAAENRARTARGVARFLKRVAGQADASGEDDDEYMTPPVVEAEPYPGHNWQMFKHEFLSNKHPYHVGIGTHTLLLLEQDAMSPGVIDRIADARWVWDAMRLNRRSIAPSLSDGPQDAEWGPHLQYSRLIAGVAKDRLQEQKKRWARDTLAERKDQT